MKVSNLLHYLFLLLLSHFAFGQNDFKSTMKEANAAFDRGEYETAIKKFRAAQAFDITKKAQVDKEIDKVFDAIRMQRDAAIDAQKKAEKLELEAKESAEMMKTALEQLEKEKNATEEQRKRAEEQKRLAEENALLARQKTDEANFQKNEANRAYETLEAITSAYVRSLNKEADSMIYLLQYEKALGKLKQAAYFKSAAYVTAVNLAEIAYFFNEVGKFNRAYGVLDSVLMLTPRPDIQKFLGESPKSRHSIRKALQMLDSLGYQALELKYYPQMLPVNGGTFFMSYTTDGDLSVSDKEHFLALIDPFDIAATETTFWQWAVFCYSTKKNIEHYSTNPKGDHPVSNVGWYEAVEYTNWLDIRYEINRHPSETTIKQDLRTKGFRLPTEAEWEYAAKGGIISTNFIYSGSDSIEDVAWYKSNSHVDKVHGTHPVGLKKANSIGLFDMTGNVMEWCLDVWNKKQPDEPRVINNPLGSTDKKQKRLRGGHWLSDAKDCSIIASFSEPYHERSDKIGFRVVRIK